jgi:hypothetical protein
MLLIEHDDLKVSIHRVLYLYALLVRSAVSMSWIGCHDPAEWPPRFPYLISLDIYLWGHLKAMVCQVKIQSMDHLKERVRDAGAHVTLDVLKKVCHEWESRICVCYHCHGAHIEHVSLNKATIFPMNEYF